MASQHVSVPSGHSAGSGGSHNTGGKPVKIHGNTAPPVGGTGSSSHAPRTSTGRAAASRANGSSNTGKAAQASSTNWLQPLTPKQVTTQATNTVKAAYAPALQQLGQEATQENAIYAKQQEDNQFYQQWLDTKSSALQAQQQQVDSSTNALEQQLTGNELSAIGGQNAALTDAANKMAGNVSNNAASFTPGQSALGTSLGLNQQANTAQLGGQATQLLGTENIANAQTNAAELGTAGAVEAGAGKELSAFDTAMTKINDAYATTDTKEGADLEKEIARLQGVQISLSENNRNYNTAAAKLGVSIANTNSEIATRAATAKLNQAKFGELVAENNQRNSQAWARIEATDRTYKLNTEKFGWQVSRDLYERQNHLGPYKNSSTKALSATSQNVIYKAVSTASAELQQLMTTGHYTAQQAYHILQNGGTVRLPILLNGQPTGKTSIKHYTAYGSGSGNYGAVVLNSAYNLSQNNGLSQGDVTSLENLGLTNPGSRLQLAPKPGTPAGNINQAGETLGGA